ncbi:hypothetical protein SAMD00023353_7400170 [Rosellinia necatrix]|uniref:Uncharacterized protein n=1 Tax=Rosellinia necatrix TaxID=77044 RepID=A0A1W2TT31_ROSNE|nr:hypothetical protein SAMD00023353_7400170 [Rosellinia necatrix]
MAPAVKYLGTKYKMMSSEETESGSRYQSTALQNKSPERNGRQSPTSSSQAISESQRMFRGGQQSGDLSGPQSSDPKINGVRNHGPLYDRKHWSLFDQGCFLHSEDEPDNPTNQPRQPAAGNATIRDAINALKEKGGEPATPTKSPEATASADIQQPAGPTPQDAAALGVNDGRLSREVKRMQQAISALQQSAMWREKELSEIVARYHYHLEDTRRHKLRDDLVDWALTIGLVTSPLALWQLISWCM